MQQYRPLPKDDEAAIKRMKELASENRRYRRKAGDLRSKSAERDHSRFCLGQIVDVSIPGARVARFLDDLALRVGLPEEIILPSWDIAV